MNKKISLNFCFVNFLATYESRIKVLHIFGSSIHSDYENYILENSYAKIFYKHLVAVKMKVNIFIDIFEDKGHPLFMGKA